MKLRPLRSLVVAALATLALTSSLQATSNYQYKPDEYVVVASGRAPNGLYAIAAHGEGEFGDENFHLYLLDAKTGKVIGPLEEVKDPLDTGAQAFQAKWTSDSKQVAITYRVDRHESVTVRYRIDNGRATLVSGPKKATGGR